MDVVVMCGRFFHPLTIGVSMWFSGAYLEGGVREGRAFHVLLRAGVHEPLPGLPLLGGYAALHQAQVVSARSCEGYRISNEGY